MEVWAEVSAASCGVVCPLNSALCSFLPKEMTGNWHATGNDANKPLRHLYLCIFFSFLLFSFSLYYMRKWDVATRMPWAICNWNADLNCNCTFSTIVCPTYFWSLVTYQSFLVFTIRHVCQSPCSQSILYLLHPLCCWVTCTFHIYLLNALTFCLCKGLTYSD